MSAAPDMPTVLTPAAGTILTRLNFGAATYPVGLAIELSWDLPDSTLEPNDIPMVILRRERRFPGLTRRGSVATTGTLQDLQDGEPVYRTGAFVYDFEETWEEPDGDRLINTVYQYVYRGTPRDRVLVRCIRRELLPGSSTPVRTTVRVIDRDNLTPSTIYYYTAFAGGERLYSALTQASALAIERTNRTLFDLLPQIHRREDNKFPEPNTVALADADKGQLQRWMEVFDMHADLLQGLVAALRDLHNPRRVDSRLLPALAHLLGWRPKGYLDEDGQRNEIIFASQVYRTVGSIPNLAAMVNRLTGWDTRVREFATSIVLSFDDTRLETLSDGTQVYLDGRVQTSNPPPSYLTGNRLPFGSVDTTDAAAMFRLRTRAYDDTTAYTYDCGYPTGRGDYLRNNDTWYNRETIGIYIVPDVQTEFFALEEEGNRIRQIINEFLPIQVRVVFVVQPGVEVEEKYNALQDVREDFEEVGIEWKAETYRGLTETSTDVIPGWRWFVTNIRDHRLVDTTSIPPETSSRTWHTGLDQEL